MENLTQRDVMNMVEDIICDSEVICDYCDNREGATAAEKLMDDIRTELAMIEARFWCLLLNHSAGEVPKLVRDIDKQLSGFHNFFDKCFEKWKAKNGTKEP